MTEEERTDYALFELNKLLKYIVYPEDVACIYMSRLWAKAAMSFLPGNSYRVSVKFVINMVFS
ncbi:MULTISPECIES: hypothetical protein [unclassified Roseburia]|uniref:hypothetical protein n=1 Tax=unclassified Roseburia TaxID=2637578 RepID=UPI001FAB21F0|nr:MULTISPECIES: hypothetical protein [unclassified Roseburia]